MWTHIWASMQPPPTYNFGLNKIFFLFTAHSVCGKKQLTFEIRGQLIKNSIFFPDTKSHTQVDSLSAKNASEKFSRLGTFNVTLEWIGQVLLVHATCKYAFFSYPMAMIQKFKKVLALNLFCWVNNSQATTVVLCRDSLAFKPWKISTFLLTNSFLKTREK